MAISCPEVTFFIADASLSVAAASSPFADDHAELKRAEFFKCLQPIEQPEGVYQQPEADTGFAGFQVAVGGWRAQQAFRRLFDGQVVSQPLGAQAHSQPLQSVKSFRREGAQCV